MEDDGDVQMRAYVAAIIGYVTDTLKRSGLQCASVCPRTWRAGLEYVLSVTVLGSRIEFDHLPLTSAEHGLLMQFTSSVQAAAQGQPNTTTP